YPGGEAPPEVVRAISAEQGRFALAVLAEDPAGVTLFALRAALEQMARFGSRGVWINHGAFDGFREALPADVLAATEASLLHRAPGLLHGLTLTTWLSVAASLALMLRAMAGLAARDRGALTQAQARGLWLAGLLLLGLALNAVICGVLASPYDRF